MSEEKKENSSAPEFTSDIKLQDDVISSAEKSVPEQEEIYTVAPEVEEKAISEIAPQPEGEDEESRQKKAKESGRKRKWRKIFFWAAVIFLLLAFCLGPIVRICAEKIVPAVLGVPLTISSLKIYPLTGYVGAEGIKLGDSKGLNAEQFVSIGKVEVLLYKGSADVKDILIANPEGFNEKYLLNLKHAKVDLDPGTLLSEKLRIEEILVEGTDFYYEPQITGQDNVKKLEEYVNTTFKVPADQKKKEPQKIQVDKIRIRDIDVATVVLKQNVVIPMIPIRMEKLGTGPDGITVGDIFIRLLDKLSLGATTAIKDNIGNLGKFTKDVGTQSTKVLESTGDQIKSGFNKFERVIFEKK